MNNPLTDERLQLLALKTANCYEGKRVEVPESALRSHVTVKETISHEMADHIASTVRQIALHLLDGRE